MDRKQKEESVRVRKGETKRDKKKVMSKVEIYGWIWQRTRETQKSCMDWAEQRTKNKENEANHWEKIIIINKSIPNAI